MPLPRSILAPVTPEDRDLHVVQGSMPDGIGGEIIISAPHASTLGPPHAFFGAGMSYRLSLQPGTFGATPQSYAWRQAWIDSPSARLQHKRPDVFNATMLGVQSPFGLVNAANTAPLPWGDRLFMTWDVGRPVEIDPVSLQFLGEVGRADEWQVFDLMPGPVLPMITSTAHPVIDPERHCLWTVNTYFGQLFIVRWDGEGPVRRWPITGAVMPQSVHTITQTRDWIVVGDCAFKVEPQVMAGGERTEPANADEPIYLIRKSDLEGAAPGTEVACHTYHLAPEMNHYYAAYDDSDGVVVLFEHTENADIAMASRVGDIDAWGRPVDPALAGLYGFAMTPTKTSMHRFDPHTGEQRELAMLYEPQRFHTRQLSAFDWSHEGWLAPEAFHSVYHGFRPEAVVQRMLDLYRDRVDRGLLPSEEMTASLATHSWDGLHTISEYVYRDLGDLPSSPIFVPVDAGAEGRTSHGGARPGGLHGWVVVPVMSDAGFRVEIFAAGNVGAGPQCTLAAPNHAVPFILHSAWMPRVVAAGDHDRTRFGDDLGRVDELPDDLAATAREVARELDDAVPMT
jgi:all-trans-8'-apo-beta-carotenal 15,15'-oxygenase